MLGLRICFFIIKIHFTEEQSVNKTFSSQLGQVAWVVSDIQAAEKFFQDVMGVRNFVKLENLRAEDTAGTYYGKPGDYVFHLYMAYSGDTLIEIIQPVSGQSIFQDYLGKHPEGGVQHIAYVVSDSEFSKSISELNKKGYEVIQSLNLPVANVAFFDTIKKVGVVTEIIGLTAAGVDFLRDLKIDAG
ncbi:VOC family protein [Flavisolibacter sp. BT320]|nr:VOC family protein [Flavisolibacter longurius]